MRFEFRNVLYALPDPEAGDNDRVIRVQHFAVFEKPSGAFENRFQYANTLQKLFFFLLREGPGLTMRKVRASLIQRKVLAEREVILACGPLLGVNGTGLAVGPQNCPYSDLLVFPAQCVVEISGEDEIAPHYLNLERYFQRFPEVLEELYHHSPFSGRELRFNLRDVLEESGNIQEEKRGGSASVQSLSLPDSSPKQAPGEVRQGSSGLDLFLAGAGAYAYAYILRCLRSARFHTVVDINPALASIVGDKYGFAHWETSTRRALERLDQCPQPVLTVATYHSTHVDIVEQALTVNPETRILLEKPPVTSREQLKRLLDLRQEGAWIEIGYNRRHVPMVEKARDLLGTRNGPIVMTCIIKELGLPDTHWYYWPNQGTRITGNLCHWVDLGTYLIGQPATHVDAVSSEKSIPGDEVTAVVTYEDGSRLTLVASDLGSPVRGVQEYIDIRRGDMTIQIHDFLRTEIQIGGRRNVRRSVFRDKGHARMYRQFLQDAEEEKGPRYPNLDLEISSGIYLSLLDAVRGKKKQLHNDSG